MTTTTDPELNVDGLDAGESPSLLTWDESKVRDDRPWHPRLRGSKPTFWQRNKFQIVAFLVILMIVGVFAVFAVLNLLGNVMASGC